MFKVFLEETKWLLIIMGVIITVLVGNVLYFMHQDNKIAEDTVGIPDQIWKIYEYEDPEGMVFTQLTRNLYSLTGPVKEGDCEKIVPQMPTDEPFTLILESGGGSLADGGCLAAHIKIRNVVTVLRDTPILNEDGEILYQPGLVPEEEEMKGRSMCASACSLMFIAGDVRYLIGDVWLGIHSPRTPEGAMNGIGKRALEANAYRTAAALLLLLEQIGVVDDKLRMLFIQVPSSTMYWLSPNDWDTHPVLRTLATHYRDFWGFSGESVISSTQQ
jgi:hypothetical protein